MKITDRIVQSPLKFMLFSGGKMKIRLSEHFTYGKLMRFVFPSIIMMIFTSIYGVVDGIFVSNFVGQTPFAAVNLVMPLVMVFGGIGFMLGTGGTALVAKTFGEGKDKRANELFSMLIVVTIIIGVVVGVVGLFLIRPVSILFGAEGEMLEDCVTYGSIILIGTASFMLQNVFQSFLITAEKPKLGLAVTVAAGVTNMFLDWLFMAIFEWGVAGAAIAAGSLLLLHTRQEKQAQLAAAQRNGPGAGAGMLRAGAGALPGGVCTLYFLRLRALLRAGL